MQDNTIKLQVEMLPIQNHDGYCHKSELTLFDKKIKIQEHSSHAGQNNPMRHAASILQHLYFISNNDIKKSGKIPTKGTWCYRWYDKSINNHVGVIEKYREGLERESIFLNEIVASTDPAIGLPTIPTTWIRDVYVPSNGSIKEVELEVGEAFYNSKKLDAIFHTVPEGFCDIFIPNKVTIPTSELIWAPRIADNNEVCVVTGPETFTVAEFMHYIKHNVPSNHRKQWADENRHKITKPIKLVSVVEAAKGMLIEMKLPTFGDFFEGYISGAIFGAEWQKEQSKTN